MNTIDSWLCCCNRHTAMSWFSFHSSHSRPLYFFPLLYPLWFFLIFCFLIPPFAQSIFSSPFDIIIVPFSPHVPDILSCFFLTYSLSWYFCVLFWCNFLFSTSSPMWSPNLISKREFIVSHSLCFISFLFSFSFTPIFSFRYLSLHYTLILTLWRCIEINLYVHTA